MLYEWRRHLRWSSCDPPLSCHRCCSVAVGCSSTTPSLPACWLSLCSSIGLRCDGDPARHPVTVHTSEATDSSSHPRPAASPLAALTLRPGHRPSVALPHRGERPQSLRLCLAGMAQLMSASNIGDRERAPSSVSACPPPLTYPPAPAVACAQVRQTASNRVTKMKFGLRITHCGCLNDTLWLLGESGPS